VVGGTAYVVGGFTGTHWLNTILAWKPGAAPHVAARLPVPLRYAAVAAAAGKLVIAGGSTPAGTASRAILSFDPARRRVRAIGRLPAPTTHAAAATLRGLVYVIGGRGTTVGTPTGRISAVDPTNGRLSSGGMLAAPRSDLAAVAVRGGILLVGGRRMAGPDATIAELAPGRSARRASAKPQPHQRANVYAADGAGMLSPIVRGDRPLVYVPNSQSDTVDEIDQRTLRVVRHFAVGGLPQHVTPSWDLKTLYVLNDLGNSLTPIDPRTGRPAGASRSTIPTTSTSPPTAATRSSSPSG